VRDISPRSFFFRSLDLPLKTGMICMIINNFPMKKILIIEDDIGISESLKLYLENSDFEVDIFRS